MEEKQHGGGKQRKPADDLSVILHMILRLTELSARRERLLMITFATISGKLSEARWRLCPPWNASRSDNEQLRRSLRWPCLSCVLCDRLRRLRFGLRLRLFCGFGSGLSCALRGGLRCGLSCGPSRGLPM